MASTQGDQSNIKPYATGPPPVCILDKAKDKGWGIPIHVEFALKK